MPLEFSAGAVIFRKEDSQILYLTIKSGYGHWDIVKGVIGDKVKGEKSLDAVVREVEEETGIKDLKFVEGFKHEYHYFYRRKGKTYYKTVKVFLAETKRKRIKLSYEHTDYKWLNYKDALGQITHEGTRSAVKKADKFLKRKK